MPATGHDVPTELFDIIVAHIPVATNETKFPFVDPVGPGSPREHCYTNYSIPLVCVRWAQIYRSTLWSRRDLRITSLEQAQWFKWIATNRGSERLTPVIDMIDYVDVVQNVEAPKSWLHLLWYTSTRYKLRNLELTGTSGGPGVYTPLHHSSPHWGLSKPLSPSFTPYRKVTLTRVSLPSLQDALRLLSYFRHTTQIWLDHANYTAEHPNTDHIPRKSRHHAIMQVNCKLIVVQPDYVHFMLALVARGRTCPLMQSSEVEQVQVWRMITDSFPHSTPTVDLTLDFTEGETVINCNDDELGIRTTDDQISLYYVPSPLTPKAKTVIRVFLSFFESWSSTLPSILAQLPFLQDLVIILGDMVKLETFLADPAIQDLVRRPEMRVRAMYPRLEYPDSWGQAELQGFVLVDPFSLQPTGEVLPLSDIMASTQVDVNEDLLNRFCQKTSHIDLDGADFVEWNDDWQNQS